MAQILIVEDDPAILRGLEARLQEEHYHVISATSGKAGYELALQENVDLIILDIMLPEMNGTEVCRNLRNAGVDAPILMISSRGDELDKVLGLEIGADDYVTKPFSLTELMARVRALLRRQPKLVREIEEYSVGGLHFNFIKHEASKDGTAIELSAKEFAILKFFAAHEGQVVTREMLLSEVWGYEAMPTTRTVDNYILSIRKKIEDDPSKPTHLVTSHAAGYKLVK
ncbi:MAG: response regulator transcription factor [Candidatus Marinimicrobia bacterium]|nr:response regulator transcription factor [Candidatus Neomarinimicrobiota bacterium]